MLVSTAWQFNRSSAWVGIIAAATALLIGCIWWTSVSITSLRFTDLDIPDPHLFLLLSIVSALSFPIIGLTIKLFFNYNFRYRPESSETHAPKVMNMAPVFDDSNTTTSMNVKVTTPGTTTNTNSANSNLDEVPLNDAYETQKANHQRYHFSSNMSSSGIAGSEHISITIHAPEIEPIVTDISSLPPDSDIYSLRTPISSIPDDDSFDNITISIDGDIDETENDIDTSSELDSAEHDSSLMDSDYAGGLGVGGSGNGSEGPSSSLGLGLSRRRKGKMRAGLRSPSSAPLSPIISPSRQEEMQAASKIVCPPPSPGISLTSVQTPNGSRRPVIPHQIANASATVAYGVNVNGVAPTAASVGTGTASTSNSSGSGTLFPVPLEGSSFASAAQGTSTASPAFLTLPPSTSSFMPLPSFATTSEASVSGSSSQNEKNSAEAASTATPQPAPPPPPITRIPVELLCEIFSHYVQGGDPKPRWRTTDRPDSGGFDTTPLLLGRICRYWRMVSLLMPSLWSEITIRKPKERHVRLAAIWLQRSGRHPLTLTLQQQPVSPVRRAGITPQGETGEEENGGRLAMLREKKRREEEKVATEIMKLFLKHIGRWQDVTFAFVGKSGSPLISLLVGSIRPPLTPSPDDATVALNPSAHSDDEEESYYDATINTVGGIRPSSATLLRSSAISLQGWDMQSVNSFWKRLYASPTLSSVDWVDCYKTTLPPNVPWEQMASVNLGRNIDIHSAMFDVLPRCKKLKQLSLSRLKLRDIDGLQGQGVPTATSATAARGDPEPLFLPHLHSLTIKVSDPRIAQLLDTLILPSLTKLELFQSSVERLPNVQCIVDLVKRSKCKLTHLAVMDSSMGEEQLLKLIGMKEIQNHLKELEIWSPMTDRVMQALTLDWINSEIDSESDSMDTGSRWKGKRKCGSWLAGRRSVAGVEGNRYVVADDHSDGSSLDSPSCTSSSNCSPSSSGIGESPSSPIPSASASSPQPLARNDGAEPRMDEFRIWLLHA
ncbi:hypothetical protein AX16_000706 [Volvariella volvacea WC 439]|nr:hypothetical protein AX16_000706 [Volvariella volvacea WC 439]